MKNKTYKWLERLVDKITDKNCPNNNCFDFYGRRVVLQSDTRDYMDVHISDDGYENQINFSFDFWTYDLCFTTYNNFDERDSIIQSFRKIYNGWGRVKVQSDEPWDAEVKSWEPYLDNDNYNQETIRKEYDYLMERKVA